MSKNRKIKPEEKIRIVQECIDGKISQAQAAEEAGVKKESVRTWIAKYHSEGSLAFLTHEGNRVYSPELKRQAVQDYLSGGGSLLEISKKYKIRSKTQLERWIKVYNSGKDFYKHKMSGGSRMKKTRKTTQEERAQIVAFCIEHGKDYALTMATYQVSYQQIYSWVRKYEASGVNGLVDRRGKTKPADELTETERLRQENRMLQAMLKDKEMEIALLKKLRELRGGGWSAE